MLQDVRLMNLAYIDGDIGGSVIRLRCDMATMSWRDGQTMLVAITLFDNVDGHLAPTDPRSFARFVFDEHAMLYDPMMSPELPDAMWRLRGAGVNLTFRPFNGEILWQDRGVERNLPENMRNLFDAKRHLICAHTTHTRLMHNEVDKGRVAWHRDVIDRLKDQIIIHEADIRGTTHAE